ncbi:MAG: hypothetical protein ACOH13_12710 [Flavobacteriales bacterium]
MSLEFLGTAIDLRTTTPVVYAKAPIQDYLALVGEDFEAFGIQRRREKHKSYRRMKNDLMQGALLPTITLCVKPELVTELRQLLHKSTEDLMSRLGQAGQVNILDGLQRTYILKDLEREGVSFLPNQTLLLEFWLEDRLPHLIYRIIVLNSGQKPMSMRHQVELLFSTFKKRIEDRITGLELLLERNSARRRTSRKYALDNVAVAFQAFLTMTPEIRRDNVVAQELIESDALEASEEEFTKNFDAFIEYLERYAALDDEMCRLYNSDREDRVHPSVVQLFGGENMMSSFFAAVAQFRKNENMAPRIKIALQKLYQELTAAGTDQDPFALVALDMALKGVNPSKSNVGFATRLLLTNGFKEYFRDEGSTPLSLCWPRAAV